MKAGPHGKLPFIYLNMAMTADGKIATANRRVSSFGSRRDQEHLLELRASADAVMAGARTVDSGPVSLGPGPRRFREQRVRHGLAEYNLRVVVSRSCSVAPDAAIFSKHFSPIIVLTTEDSPATRRAALQARGAIVKSFGQAEINFPGALKWLREAWGIKRLLCEGGGELNSALIKLGLVDELHLTVCPWIFGGDHAPTMTDGISFRGLAAAARLALHRQTRHGEENFLVYKFNPRPSGQAARANRPAGSNTQ